MRLLANCGQSFLPANYSKNPTFHAFGGKWNAHGH